MNLYLDNIIFSLQHAGGISVFWYELLKRILNDPDINPVFIDELNQNLFRQELPIPVNSILKNPLAQYPMIVQRYLNPNKINGTGIFHSSYYRTVNNPKMVNITTVHDFTYEYFRIGIAKIVHQRQKGNAIKKSKRIICVSQNTRDDLLKFYPEIRDNQVTIIYNGVNEIYHPVNQKNKTQIKQIVSFPSGQYVLYIGERKALYKNFKETVLACEIAQMPLVIVGGGAFTKRENDFLSNHLKTNSYEILSRISNEQLNLVYNHALCLLYPSRYEGFGLPVIEAQKAGCPVICSNCSSIPEVAGKGAIILEKETEGYIADILKQITRNPSLTSKMREEGLKNARRFSWEKCYQQTKQVYNEVYEEYLS